MSKIEPEKNLVHAIGYGETNMQTYTYETLVVGGDYSQQVLLEERPRPKIKLPISYI